VAGRTAPRGYAPTNERNRFTGHARDRDTGYDHTLWRKLDSVQGRWTSPDPYGGSMEIGNPQSFNRYAYVLNDPVNLMDPLGLFQLAPQVDYSGLWSLWLGRQELLEVAIQPVGEGGGGGIIGDNQQNGSETKSEKKPCPSVPESPPGVSVDENIKKALRHKFSGPFRAYSDAKWFKNKVTHKGPWDYKRIDIKYENFGNFNYGATGAAIGFDLITLHSEAGRTQAVPPGMTEKPKEWGYPAGRGFGKGKYPYGDEPKDAIQVAAGFEYYVRKFVLKDCP
jgi:type VI secretion system secreted protein VgrG